MSVMVAAFASRGFERVCQALFALWYDFEKNEDDNHELAGRIGDSDVNDNTRKKSKQASPKPKKTAGGVQARPRMTGKRMWRENPNQGLAEAPQWAFFLAGYAYPWVCSRLPSLVFFLTRKEE
jgi:hypothetical protein